MSKIITVEEVKELAMKYYEKGGDRVIECSTDEEIQKDIDGYTEMWGPHKVTFRGKKSKAAWLKQFKEWHSMDEEYRAAARYFSGEDY